MSGTNSFSKTDLFRLHHVIQSSMIVYPKEIIIATLRDFFSKDSYYHYAKDQFGFANTTDHTDLPPGGDIPTQFNKNGANQEGLSTRLFIGENYRYDGIYYPAILVKSGGSRYVPISINRDKGGIQYTNIFYEDGYGNQTVVNKPIAFFTAGAFEGSIVVDIMTRSLRSRDELAELVMMCFVDIAVDSLYDVGLIVKPPQLSGTSETEDRNDKLFRQSITLDIRTEYRRVIPIDTIIDSILFTVNFQDLASPNSVPDPNLAIVTRLSLIDQILDSKTY